MTVYIYDKDFNVIKKYEKVYLVSGTKNGYLKITFENNNERYFENTDYYSFGIIL